MSKSKSRIQKLRHKVNLLFAKLAARQGEVTPEDVLSKTTAFKAYLKAYAKWEKAYWKWRAS